MVDQLQGIFIFYGWFLLSLSVHEWGHAWVACLLGDNTPKIEGRLTLNPLAHISFIGTVVVPLLMLFLPGGMGVVGWAKPVVVNTNNFKWKKWGDVLCSAAGPLMNFILGFLILALGFFVDRFGSMWSEFCVIGASVNVTLGLFNMLPIPPLDGSHVLKVLTGMSEATFLTFSQVGIFLLMIVINLPIFDYYFILVRRGVLDHMWRFLHSFL